MSHSPNALRENSLFFEDGPGQVQAALRDAV